MNLKTCHKKSGILMLLLATSIHVNAQVFTSKTTLFSEPNAFQGWYTESVYSPLESHNGNLYFVMLDNNRRPHVGKITSGGSTSVLPLDQVNTSYKPVDDGHHEFSIGVDKDGYIHITGDMHNYPQAHTSHIPGSYSGSNILYWKSKNPEDISDFEFMGNNSSETIPGEAWGYGQFFTDRNGELYYSSRTLARNLYWQNGGRGIGLYSYNITTKQWTAKGSLATTGDASFPVIAWELSGRDGGSYQLYKAGFWFDKNNRMHFTGPMNTNNSSSDVNAILYAYSDDGGNTFYRADGTPITLPMNTISGPQQADIVAIDVSGDFDQPSIAAAWNNYPVVQYQYNGSGYYKYWDGSNWSSAQNSPISTRDKILFNEHTNQLLFIDIHSGMIYAKDNPTGSNQTYDAGETFRYYDYKTFRTQNILHGINWRSSTGNFEVIKLEGPSVGPPPDCNGDSGGTAYIDSCGVCAAGNTGVVPNSTCSQDCNGEWDGSAYLDTCGVCVGGSTGVLPCDQIPYPGTPHSIPGIIETEDYDVGANGIAYNDDTPGNTGTEYRSDDVDIETSSLGGYNVGWTAGGEWLEYIVDISQSADYEFSIVVATDQSGSLHLENDGASISDVINVSGTGGWQTWDTLTAVNPVSLSSGIDTIRLFIDQGPLNIEKFELQLPLITGVNSDKHDIHVYPNPSNTSFSISQSQPWSVTDLSGRTLVKGNGDLIPMDPFPSGMYLLHISHQVIQLWKY